MVSQVSQKSNELPGKPNGLRSQSKKNTDPSNQLYPNPGDFYLWVLQAEIKLKMEVRLKTSAKNWDILPSPCELEENILACVT